MENKYKSIRLIIYVVEIIIVFVIQQTPSFIPEIFGGRPMLLIPLIVSVVMFQNETISIFLGLFVGIMMDFGVGSIIGLYAIIMTFISYAISFFSGRLIKINILSGIIFSFLSITIIYMINILLTCILYGFDNFEYMFMNHYLSRMIYTFAFTPLFYFMNKSVEFSLRPKY